MRTGFFRALIGSCSGTAIFEQLKQQKLPAAIWHFFVMSVICGIVIWSGIYPAAKKTTETSIQVFVKNCGTLILSADKFEPQRNANKPRCFTVAGPMSFLYLPESATALPENYQQDCKAGILWSGLRIGVWEKAPDGTLFLYSGTGRKVIEPATDAALLEALRNSPRAINTKYLQMSGKTIVMNSESVEKWLDGILICCVAGMIVVHFVQIVFYIGVFAAVSMVMNLGRKKRFTFRELVVLAIYAGFPAMIIGSVAEALRLPGLSFDVIYVLGMTIYLVIIMNRIEYNRQQRQWQQHDA